MNLLLNTCKHCCAYNEWANKRFSDWLTQLDIDLLTREVKSSYKSIDLTIQHMLRAQKFWHLFIMESDYAHFDWSVKTGHTLAILQELQTHSELMRNDFSQLTEDELSKELYLDMSWARNQQPRLDYILHVVNHSTYHRGQVVTIARQLGVQTEIPNTDYNIYKSTLYSSSM